MSRLGLFMAAFVAAGCMSACSSDDDSSPPADGAGGTAAAGAAGGTAVAGGTGGTAVTGGGTAANPVTFTADIHPILQAKCGTSGCHDGSQAPILPGHGAADVDEAYDATQTVSYLGGPVYERILLRVGTTDPNFMMPPNPPCSGMLGGEGCITADELALIQEWVDQGAPR